ncbi:MAG: hypothetical protein M0P31_13090 [Solirubrobacteraceae bacterium]|nr:hypothetical protein [Solirubrobacteraceae bacterium]
MRTATDIDMRPFAALLGAWTISGTHRLLPDVDAPGRVTYEWLEGERFLLGRTRVDHPDIPDSLTVTGPTDDGLGTRYFDSRGVQRLYATDLRDGTWTMHRAAPGFHQRFRATFDATHQTITGAWDLSPDGVRWDHDLALTYRRVG